MAALFYLALPLAIVLGHIGALPLIFAPELFGIEQHFTIEQQTGVALIIAPLTSASFITVVKYAVDNRSNSLDSMPKIGSILYPIVAIIVVLSFFISIYYFIISFQANSGASIEVLKGMVGVTEVFFGAAYAVIVSSLAGQQVPANPSPAANNGGGVAGAIP